ncbi:hypothetical protein KY315_04060, partial [Candidatus Woesearchaeota archaeon]|nr:hypothetical protein [Candidatus Woesearchaeota archaeon]
MKKDIKENPTRIDREADGKQELDYGIEDLDKDKIHNPNDKFNSRPFDLWQSDHQKKYRKLSEKKDKVTDPGKRQKIIDSMNKITSLYKNDNFSKSDIQARWELLKAKLDNKTAILNIQEEMQPDMEEQNEDAPMDQEQPTEDQDAVQEEDMGAEQPSDASSQSPDQQELEEEIGDKLQQAHETGDETQAPADSDEDEDDDMLSQDASQDEEQEGEKSKQDIFEDELLQMQLQNEGFTQAQIDYILHGHIPATATAEDIRTEAEKAMGEIKQIKAKNDQTQESQHKQELHEQNKEQKDSMHQLK